MTLSNEMINYIQDLADVFKKHKGGLTYTISDDGVHAILGSKWESSEKACLGFPMGGDISEIRQLIHDQKK